MKNFNKLTAVLILSFISSALFASDQYTQKKSPYSVSKTIDRIESVLKKKGITVFARVDHKAGANKAGLKMTDAQLLIFGNPKLGTPLMNENILMGIELPMKVLSWKDKNDQVWLAYVNPAELKRRNKMIKNDVFFNKMEKALEAVTNKAISH
ncbi:hypothetical protein MNBD_GAMMA09-3846 [hydrothermal vent metagenome]|uniref:DUF302 domain-containing protein n=1 Tax=hydrothermal vent metagenome TaxID=652676 RepID=A0A3B0XIU9_9ZZZZ